MDVRHSLRLVAAATTVTALGTLGAIAPAYAEDAPALPATAAEAAVEATGSAGGTADADAGGDTEDADTDAASTGPSADESAAVSAEASVEASVEASAGTSAETSAEQGPPENHTTGPDHSLGNASTQGTVPSPQPESSADQNDGGANAYDCEDGPEGPYCATTRHESENGVGDGEAVGRPAAGSVGRADNKNPPGQEPGPEDGNRGYECDMPGDVPNQGIAEGNPAHTGCEEEAVTPPEQPVTPPEQPVTPPEQPVTPPEQPVTPPEQPVVPEQPVIQPVEQPVEQPVSPPAVQPVEEVAGVQQERVPSAGVLPAAGAEDNGPLVLAGGSLLALGLWLLTWRRTRPEEAS